LLAFESLSSHPAFSRAAMCVKISY
jgi:hypothetical protein